MMRIRFSLIFLIILFSQKALPQFDYYKPKDTITRQVEVYNRHFIGEKKISLSPNVLTSPDYGAIPAGGIKFQVFISRRFSLDADLVIGRDYLHTGPGLIGIPFWLLFFSESGFESDEGGGFTEFLIMLVAGILSFEHVSYHVPVKKDLEFSPYISMLRLKQYTPPDNTSYDGAQASFAAGVQMDKYFGRFFISPYAEYCIGYSDGVSGFNAGVYMGISFPVKK